MLAEVDQQEDRDRLQVRLNTIIGALAGRDDLTLECLWNPERQPGQPKAPAWFTPADARVVIDARFALQGADPADVNPLTPAGRRAHPVIIGLGCHEGGHAHSTQWEPDTFADVPPAVAKAAVLLEEPRIEYRQLQRRPQDRPYLRAQSVLIDLSGFSADAAADRYRAASVAVMILARADAGVLEEDDAAHVEPILEQMLGDDLPLLRDLWLEVLDLEDGDADGLIDVATRWVEVLGEPPADGGPSVGCGSPAAGGSVPGEDEWDNPDEDGDGEPGDALSKALAAALANAVEGATDEVQAGAPQPAAAAEKAAQAQQDAADVKEQKQDAKSAEKLFAGVGPVEGAKEGGDIGPTRPPTTAERRMAKQIGHVLRKARYRDPVRTTHAVKLPPGRMNGRAAMLGTAQRSMGMPATAKPFKRTTVAVVPEPPVTLGFLSDASGSMDQVSGVVASCMWAFAHAVTYVQGRSASVVFGNRVRPVVRPGAPPTKVTTLLNNSGSHDIKGGIEALDGILNLSMGRGVRMLVVVSDGHFEAHQLAAAEKKVGRLVRRGVIVLWVDVTTHAPIIPAGAQHVKVPMVETKRGWGQEPDVAAIPGLIGDALAEAVRAA